MRRILGPATLYQGDCSEVIGILGQVDTVLTDPPYNVGLPYTRYDDDRPEDEYLSWLGSVFGQCAEAGASNIVWFWQGSRLADGQARACLPDGFRIHHVAAWYKREFAGDLFKANRPAFCWEPIIWATSDDEPEYRGPRGGHDGRDCIVGNSSRHDVAASGHPCPKTESVVRTVLAWLPGDVILDPLMGSGTVGVAALALSRRFIGIELVPEYFEIARQRIEKEALQERLFPGGD